MNSSNKAIFTRSGAVFAGRAAGAGRHASICPFFRLLADAPTLAYLLLNI